MNLEKILSIAGKPGLYALKVQTRTGYLAESLIDGKKISVSLKANVSLLSEISIYTVNEEKLLTDVMRNIAIKENEGPAISHKEDNAKLIAYFSEVLPEYDPERVYPSDIKKILNWYNLLQAKAMVSKEVPVAAESTSEIVSEKIEDGVENEIVEEKVVEKAKSKKTTAKK
jgi:hypothetical protein